MSKRVIHQKVASVAWTDDTGGTVMTIDATDVTGDGTITNNYTAIIEVWAVSAGTNTDAGSAAVYAEGAWSYFSAGRGLDVGENATGEWRVYFNEGTGITSVDIVADGTDVIIDVGTDYNGNHTVCVFATIRIIAL